MSVIVVTLTVQGYEQAKYSKYSGMIISLGPGSAVEKAKKIGKPSELSISLGRELEREKGRQSTARLASLTDYLMLFHSIFCYFSPKGEPGPCLVDY